MFISSGNRVLHVMQQRAPKSALDAITRRYSRDPSRCSFPRDPLPRRGRRFLSHLSTKRSARLPRMSIRMSRAQSATTWMSICNNAMLLMVVADLSGGKKRD